MNSKIDIPYSAQYNTMNREGHECPPPTFGAPTLVWHLGISPHDADASAAADVPLDESHEKAAGDYEQTRQNFFRDVNSFLRLLQGRIRFPRKGAEQFAPDRVPRPWDAQSAKLGNPFRVTEPENIRFTLWWPDDLSRASPEPTADALRIKVHATAYRDYVTISLYLDAGKPWNLPAFVRGDAVVGDRRQSIFEHVQAVHDRCEPRLAGSDGARPILEREILPETDVSATDAAALMRASRFLYTELWDEFWDALQLPPMRQIIGQSARVFANFRGLVLSTWGSDDPDKMPRVPGSAGDLPFPRFGGNGGLSVGGRTAPEPNEANAVLKAFWPFVRRITPNADQREYIACGVFGWRALYISALSSARAYDWDEEAQDSNTEIPAGSLPEALIQKGMSPSGQEIRIYDSQSGKEGEGPIRYLVLSKGEPHRRQIGRILDRINAMGSVRLIALRDWTIIRDASTQIQLRGLELDNMMRRYSVKRAAILGEFAQSKLEKRTKERDLQDQEDQALQGLADEVERDLIDLSAALDSIGARARNRLHFRINRSRFYAAEFQSLVGSLRIGNIDTWVAYDQFVMRGLKPAFDFIDGVGDRLLGLRARLQTVLEGIETSALVTQISATRQNTAELRSIATAVADANKWLDSAIFWLRLFSALVGAAALYLGGGGAEGIGRLIRWVIERLGL